ncbi:uncharacterized protein LOC128671148 [Plodia interpunctella]|uniref:uncharacterized protein LOC128671148 n=1 Tax=Plodia interpunctella TaxID=58824 RepID=UPI0023680E25|nr:uncharacterized protein LOC128671148 [Plodia interpunctella]
MNITSLIYWLGLPDFWKRDTPRSKKIVQIHEIYCYSMVVLSVVMIIFELGAFFTQPNLNERQSSNMILFGISHPFLLTFILSTLYYIKEMRCLLYTLAVELRAEYNDKEIETSMVKKIKVYTASFISFFLVACVFYGIDALVNVVKNDATFTTVVVAWPEVHDQSPLAGAVRVLFYLVFWSMMLALCGVYTIVIATTICLNHQYKNLQSYFCNLAGIFEENISQYQKERKYVEGFKLGVTMHSKTLWCRQQLQTICTVIFSSQVVTNVIVLILMLYQMLNAERTLFALFSSVFTFVAILCSTALFMLNAGDVTIEALAIPTAMYQSGWQHCAPARVRKLLVCAMMQGQQPEVLWALGIVPMSYESYVSIVKSSYTMFSVIYSQT